jgi:hypothetical protein
MNPVTIQLLPSLAEYYQVTEGVITDLILDREIPVLQALTDLRRPGGPEELYRVLDSRDVGVKKVAEALLEKLAELDAQIVVARRTLGDVNRLRVVLDLRYRAGKAAPPENKG